MSSIKKTFDILSLFTIEKPRLGVFEIASMLDMNKSTASRILAQLYNLNILNKCNGRKYCLGNKVVDLARVYISTLDLKTIAAPILSSLSEKTSEMVGLSEIANKERIFIDWKESSRPIKFIVDKEHIRAPLHAGAPGKILLAYISENHLDEIIDTQKLVACTPYTITERSELLKELSEIRKNGYAFSSGEHNEHAFCVAAPINNHLNHVVAGIFISWLKIYNKPGYKNKYIKLVKSAAAEISAELGFRGSI